MKERSIILRDWEVRAILDGRLKRLSRPVKAPPTATWADGNPALVSIGVDEHGAFASYRGGAFKRLASPFGEPGDRLWVKETWQYGIEVIPEIPDLYIYKADGRYCGIWKPSSNMARKASRLTLDVLSVSAGRVQDVTPTEMLDEGIAPASLYGYDCDTAGNKYDEFRDRWDADNPAFPWESNPWRFVANVERSEV